MPCGCGRAGRNAIRDGNAQPDMMLDQLWVAFCDQINPGDGWAKRSGNRRVARREVMIVVVGEASRLMANWLVEKFKADIDNVGSAKAIKEQHERLVEKNSRDLWNSVKAELSKEVNAVNSSISPPPLKQTSIQSADGKTETIQVIYERPGGSRQASAVFTFSTHSLRLNGCGNFSGEYKVIVEGTRLIFLAGGGGYSADAVATTLLQGLLP